MNVGRADLQRYALDPKVPLELYEARNAVRIARWTGADKYAADTFQKALVGLRNAEGYLVGKGGKKPIGTVAREAVQMAEDARLITLKKIEDERLTADRKAAADREARAQAQAQENDRLAQEEKRRREEAQLQQRRAEEQQRQ